jgi:repressor LexA
MPSEQLTTARQQRILEFIADTVRTRGYPPTVREIGEAVGLTSSSSVHSQLANLERKGLLHRDPTKPRAIGLSPDDSRPEVAVVPLVGRIAAGAPILAEENLQGHYQVDPNLFTPRADYLLRVRGLSMRDAGILEGDLLAVHRTQEARSGQIVVARLGDEVTVKRLRRRGHAVQLEAENPEFAPIEVDLRRDALAIEGIAVGVIRNGKSF